MSCEGVLSILELDDEFFFFFFFFFVKSRERAGGHLDPKCPPCDLEQRSFYLDLLRPRSDTHGELADVVIRHPLVFVHNLNSKISRAGDVLNAPYLIPHRR